MSKFISLLKIEVEDSFNKSSRKSYTLRTAIILGALILLLFSGVINSLLFSLFNNTNYYYFYPIILSISVSSLTFFSAIYRTKGTMFSLKDKDNLTPLPIKKGTIVATKIVLVYLEELIFSAFIFLPCLFLYSTNDYAFIFYGLVLMLTLPMISLLLAFIVGFILQLLTIRFNWLRYFGTAIYFIFIVAMCTTSVWFNSGNSTNIDVSGMQNYQETFPFNFLYSIYVEHSILTLFIYLLCAVVSFGLVILLYASCYDKFYEAMNYVGKKPKFKKENIKTGNSFLTIVKNDLKHLANEQMFLISAILPGFLAGFLLIILNYSLVSSISEVGASKEEVEQVILMVRNCLLFSAYFFLGMAAYTSLSITLEGKNFWIIKTLPIKTKTYLGAKLLENQVLEGPIMFILSIILIMLNNYDISLSIFLIIGAQVFIFSMGCLGLLANLKYPRLVWSNYKQVKNSAANTLTCLLGMLIGLIVSVSGVVLYILINLTLAIAVASAIIIVLALVLFFLLKTKGPRLYAKIEV